MKPGLRKALSVLVLALGVWHWLPWVLDLPRLKVSWLATALFAMRWDTGGVFLTCYILLLALLAGIFVPDARTNRWQKVYIVLAIVGFLITFSIQPVAAIMAFFLIPPLGIVSSGKLWPAIIAILAVILMPIPFCWLIVHSDFIDKTPYQRISRAKSDLRSMATAIEAYQLDHNRYPASTNTRPYGFWQSAEAMPSFAGGTGVAGLTTPVAYLTSYFEDPFRKLSDYRTFAYYCNGPMWILISAGPDCRFDISPDKLDAWLNEKEQPCAALIVRKYDPTNGAYSAGDIWRLKQ